MTQLNPTDRMLDLLADRTVGALDTETQAELDALFAEAGVDDDISMDLAAGAALVAMTGETEEMPAELRASVLGAMKGEAPAPDLKLVGSPAERSASQPSFLAWSGWLAAAACLVLAAVIGLNRGPQSSPVTPIDQARANFLETTTDVQVASWGDWDNPEQPGVTGQVEWSESSQRGYMTFTGLAENNVTAEQYQLWIIDERGMEQRISGAIFDCDVASGELIVEIDPSIEIHNAAAFAITIEEPGGTWVSDMTRRVVIAALG